MLQTAVQQYAPPLARLLRLAPCSSLVPGSFFSSVHKTQRKAQIPCHPGPTSDGCAGWAGLAGLGDNTRLQLRLAAAPPRGASGSLRARPGAAPPSMVFQNALTCSSRHSAECNAPECPDMCTGVTTSLLVRWRQPCVPPLGEVLQPLQPTPSCSLHWTECDMGAPSPNLECVTMLAQQQHDGSRVKPGCGLSRWKEGNGGQ